MVASWRKLVIIQDQSYCDKNYTSLDDVKFYVGYTALQTILLIILSINRVLMPEQALSPISLFGGCDFFVVM